MSVRDVGGTKGGLGEFVIGLAMLVTGSYLFLDNVIVTSNPLSIFGFSSFGLTLLPLFAGIAFLFFNGRSLVGWLLTAGGALVLFVGVIARLRIFYKPTSLFHTLIMLVLIAGGIGLVAKAVRPHLAGPDDRA